tara:strand:- start:159 stop:386 length:228 start_codon:yes stop_codon:yes gene_type:complete
MEAGKLKKLLQALEDVVGTLEAEPSTELVKLFLVRNAWDMARLALRNLRSLEGYQREHRISSGVYTDRNNSMEER